MLPIFTFGDLVLDVIAQSQSDLDHDTDTPGEVRSAPGGSAANFATWYARLGGSVRFAGRVGDDLLGRALRDDLQAEGVEHFIALDPQHPTAVLILFTQGSQRHMMVPSGASHFLEPGDLPASAIRSAGWLHLTGYSFFWEATTRAAHHALEIARETGLPISLDPSSAGFIRRKGLVLPPDVHVLMPNRDEALALTGAPDVEEAARQLGERVPLIAVKLGAQGALLCADGKLTRIPPADPDGPVVDATGAGDAWGAAFIHALRLGHVPQEAALAANRLGARIVTRRGARPVLTMHR